MSKSDPARRPLKTRNANWAAAMALWLTVSGCAIPISRRCVRIVRDLESK